MTVQYNNRLRGRTVMVLPASCPHSGVVIMGNRRHKVTVLDIPLGWCVVTNDYCIQQKKYAHQPFVTTPQPGKCTVSTSHTRDLQPGNQSPRRSLALWAVVTNDLCIRRFRAQSNDVTPVNISDEQPPHNLFNIIICCTCNMCPKAVEQAIQATTRENLSSGFPTKRVLNQSLRLNRLARN